MKKSKKTDKSISSTHNYNNTRGTIISGNDNTTIIKILNKIPKSIIFVIMLILMILLLLLYQQTIEKENTNRHTERLITSIKKFENKLVKNQNIYSKEFQKNEVQNDIKELDGLISEIESFRKTNQNNKKVVKGLYHVESTLDRLMKKYSSNMRGRKRYQKPFKKIEKNSLHNEKLESQVKRDFDVEVEDIDTIIDDELIPLLSEKEKEIEEENAFFIENGNESENSEDSDESNEGGSFAHIENENENDENVYDLKLDVSAFLGYKFDSTLMSIAPELTANIKVNSEDIKMLSGETGYTSSDTFRNLSLKKGDNLEVTIYDDDAFYFDELHTFSFVFDGKKVFDETEILTTSIEFFKDGKKMASYPPKYNANIIIEGDIEKNKDEGETLPDFSGAIYVEGRAYTIVKEQNSLTNEQVIEDVSIKINDKVSVVIIEEDVLWHPTVIMKHDFIFDGNEVMKENQKVKLYLDFVEQ